MGSEMCIRDRAKTLFIITNQADFCSHAAGFVAIESLNKSGYFWRASGTNLYLQEQKHGVNTNEMCWKLRTDHCPDGSVSFSSRASPDSFLSKCSSGLSNFKYNCKTGRCWRLKNPSTGK